VEVEGGGLWGQALVVKWVMNRFSSTPSSATSIGSAADWPTLSWESWVCTAISWTWCRATPPAVCGVCV